MPRPAMAYLAGPIAAVSTSDARSWRASLTRRLYKHEIGSFDPAVAWTVPSPNQTDDEHWGLIEAIQSVDDHALQVCDVVIVHYTGHQSVGTDHEIRVAQSHNKPIVVYRSPQAIKGPVDFAQWSSQRWLTDCPTFDDENLLEAHLANEWGTRWRRK